MTGTISMIRSLRQGFTGEERSVLMGLAALFVTLSIAIGVALPVAAAPLDKVTQVSTGPETACAVADGKVACWGRGDSGQIGNGSSKDTAKAVYAVAKEGWTETIPSRKECTFGFFCKTIPESKVEHDRTPLGGKYVTKVSVGENHACAIASARVYCWGNNSSGQLGTRSTANSSSPVAVNVADTVAAKPGYCNGKTNGVTGCGWPTGNWVNEIPAVPASSLFRKEVIDISAGDKFTCALASDGTVSCWGEGDNGRLGTNNTTDTNYPKAVHVAAGSALSGKAGVRLAKASNETMCVLAITKGQPNNGSGTPHCWGKGIDSGETIPANGSSTSACSKTSPVTKPSATTKTIIFESKQPTVVPGATLTAMDGQDYVTGLGTDSKAYYWGMYGYQEAATYSNIKTCKVNPCTGKVVIERDQSDIVLAGQVGTKSVTKKTSPNGKTKTTTTTSGRQNTARSTTTVKRNADGSTTTKTTYFKAKDKDNSNSCAPSTRYVFTKTVTNTQVGQKVTTTPPSWPQSQGGIAALSGGVYTDATSKGLFCARIANGLQCDGHGAKTTSGQLGNGSTAQLSGPQNVVGSGWLTGKQVSQLGTGSTNDNTGTSYTCAVGSGAVGCWGVNSRGQLGVGDKKIRNAPTGVEL